MTISNRFDICRLQIVGLNLCIVGRFLNLSRLYNYSFIEQLLGLFHICCPLSFINLGCPYIDCSSVLRNHSFNIYPENAHPLSSEAANVTPISMTTSPGSGLGPRDARFSTLNAKIAH